MIDIILLGSDNYDLIRKTLLSIDVQSIKDKIKVTIINDDTKKEYSKIKKEFKNLKIEEIKIDKNSSPGLAKQTGIDNTNGKFIMFINAGDLFSSPFCIEDLYRNIDDNDVIEGNTIEETKDGYSVIENNVGTIYGKMYRRSIIKNKKIKFNNSNINEGHSFNRLISLCTDKIIKVNLDVYFYKLKEYNKKVFIDSYIDNLLWTIKEAEARKCDKEKISTMIYSGLMYLYYQYCIDYDNNIIFKKKEIIDYQKKYDKYLDENERINIYKYYCNFSNIIPKISFDDFFEL